MINTKSSFIFFLQNVLLKVEKVGGLAATLKFSSGSYSCSYSLLNLVAKFTTQVHVFTAVE